MFLRSHTKDGITINTQSPKYLNSVIGHEITHVLKGSELFGSLQSTLFDYAKSRGEYDTRLNALTETYKGIENVDINEELTADLVGDYIFTDRKFVEHLLNTDRNAFGKIYDELKYLCKIATTGSKEEKALLKAKKIFDDVYSKGETNSVEGVKYSVSSGESSSIKEQLINYKTQLESMPVIAKINTVKEFNNAKEGYDWAVQTLKQSGYKTDRAGFGTIVFDEKRLKNGLRYLKTNSEYTAYALIPKVLKNGIVIGEHSNHKGRGYDTVTFTAPVEIDGVRGNMAVIVRQEGKNYYKLHRVLMPDGSLFEYKKGSSAERAAATKNAVDTPTDTTSNTIIRNSAEKSTGKFSLSSIAPEIAPAGTLKITSDDVTLKAPKVEAEAKTENVLDDDIPIRKEPTLAELRAERVGKFSDAEKSYVSMEDFANSESPIWRNVDYNDHDTKSTIMQDTHNTMVSEGSVVKVLDDVQTKVEDAFPDLRDIKKKERTLILKESINKLKNSLRQFLSSFKNQVFEFEVNGKVLEAKLYSTGINEVIEKVTQKKANMLYATEDIFNNARYLYSTTDYSLDPNVYRWNYFYTPVQIGNEIVGVRIAVRDLATPQGSQIYNWGIKKDATLDGVGRGIHNRISNGVSSDASSETSLGDVQPVNFDSSHGTSSDVSDNSIPISSQNVNSKAKKPSRREELHNNIIERIKARFSKRGFDFDEILRKAKDLSTFATVDNTPQRVMEKSLGYMEGQILADETVNKVAQNETEGIKWLNNYIAEIKTFLKKDEK